MGDGPPPSLELSELDEALLGLIKPELASGERLIWAARSRGDRRRSRARYLWPIVWLAGLLLFSVLCFAILPLRIVPGEFFVGTLTILGTTAFATSLVLGVIVVFRFVVDLFHSWRRVPDVYAVTDRRAIIWAASDTPGAIDVVITPRGTIHPHQIQRTQHPDGSGDLHFGGFRSHSSFRGVDDVRRVEILVRTYLVASSQEPASGLD